MASEVAVRTQKVCNKCVIITVRQKYIGVAIVIKRIFKNSILLYRFDSFGTRVRNEYMVIKMVRLDNFLNAK